MQPIPQNEATPQADITGATHAPSHTAAPNLSLAPEPTTAPALWIVLARAYHSIATYIEQSLVARHIGLSDFMALEVLLHEGSLSMSAIGARILLANASMTSAVDRLDRLGLVTRESSTEDRRVRLVALTPAGRDLITCLHHRHAEDLEAIMADISPADRRQLRHDLQSIGLSARAAAAASKAPRPLTHLRRPTGRTSSSQRPVPAEHSGDRPL